jgi:hypothetical protein
LKVKTRSLPINAPESRLAGIEARSEFLDTGRHFGTNPAFAIQSINQLVIAELAVIRQKSGFECNVNA